MQCSDNVCSSILNDDGYGAGDGDGGEGSKHTSKFDKCVKKGHFRVVLGGFYGRSQGLPIMPQT